MLMLRFPKGTGVLYCTLFYQVASSRDPWAFHTFLTFVLLALLACVTFVSPLFKKCKKVQL